jgi:hypothetical protein
MLSILNQAMAGILTLLFGLNAGGPAVATSPIHDEPLRCEVQASLKGHMLSLD